MINQNFQSVPHQYFTFSRYYILLTPVLAVLCPRAWCQKRAIRGIVTDSSGSVVAGANMKIANSRSSHIRTDPPAFDPSTISMPCFPSTGRE